MNTENRPRLMIVDDNLANLGVLGRLLDQQGYQVLPVPSALQALARLPDLQPDLVLLDIDMPELNGFEVCIRIKADPATCDIPVIFISAVDTIADKVRGFEIGGIDYITKPFEEQEVRVRVETHLRIHHLQQQLHNKIDQLEQANARIRELSIRDELTGLYNRRYFAEQAPALLAQARRHHRPLTFMLGDIDRFKSINDRLSHAVGDQVLRQVSSLLQASVRQNDIVARYGGEEFVIALPDSALPQAIQVAEKLRCRVADHDWSTIHPDLVVTLSLGLSDDSRLQSYEQILAMADVQLYRAKQAGRNRICY